MRFEDLEKEGGTGLIVVDLQRDFMSGGVLPVPDGDQIVMTIHELMVRHTRLCTLPRGQNPGKFSYVAFTYDWHPETHCSFQEFGGLWPRHCVQYTEGALLPEKFPATIFNFSFFKGFDRTKEAFSGFSGVRFCGNSYTDLKTDLDKSGMNQVVIVGLATEYCVLATALDSVKNGFETIVYLPCIRAVNVKPDDEEKAMEEMLDNKILLARNEEELLAMMGSEEVS